MNLFYPIDPSSKSKATWVLDAMHLAVPNSTIRRSPHVDGSIGVFWGLGGYNYGLVRRHRNENIGWIFTDMPYWNRWMGNNRGTCHWRIVPNHIHCCWQQDLPSDRFDSLNIAVRDWQSGGRHILICPSSSTVESFLDEGNWLSRTIEKLKSHTDRPVRIRVKPRNSKTSGPLAAEIPIEEDLRNAWAVVTLCSIAGVEAACAGVPVFCHPESPCAPIGNMDIADIEKPQLPDRKRWLNTLAYHQYTELELQAGRHLEVIR